MKERKIPLSPDGAEYITTGGDTEEVNDKNPQIR